MGSVKKEPCGNPQLGLKLLNFRKKLGFAIGQKKITQDEFGEMFGGRSGRVIASYELGDSEPPASLLYLFWELGNSVDNIFADGPITEAGRERARQLYQGSIAATLKTLTDAETKRLLDTIGEKHAEGFTTIKKTPVSSASSRKQGHNAPRTIKKR